MRHKVMLLFVLGMMLLVLPGLAQESDCPTLTTQAVILLEQASNAFTNADLATGQSLVAGAQALLAPCLESPDCPTLPQANTLLGQIATATDTTTASALLDGTLALMNSCSAQETVPTTPPTAVPTEAPTEIPTEIPTETTSTLTQDTDWTPVERDFDGVTMVQVPAGCFMMGSEGDSFSAYPIHEVCFDEPFWIDQTEVSQKQFAQFNGKKAEANAYEGYFRPVENITWFEASNFCELRGMRLPTEAEWEYAARGPNSLTYPWGNTWNSEYTVTDRSRDEGTQNVGSVPMGASWVGALDMSGNVDEWTHSLYADYPYDATDGRENDTGNSTDVKRVTRSSNWISDMVMQQLTRRESFTPNFHGAILGFRCASGAALISTGDTPSTTGDTSGTTPEATSPDEDTQVILPQDYADAMVEFKYPQGWEVHVTHPEATSRTHIIVTNSSDLWEQIKSIGPDAMLNVDIAPGQALLYFLLDESTITIAPPLTIDKAVSIFGDVPFQEAELTALDGSARKLVYFDRPERDVEHLFVDVGSHIVYGILFADVQERDEYRYVPYATMVMSTLEVIGDESTPATGTVETSIPQAVYESDRIRFNYPEGWYPHVYEDCDCIHITNNETFYNYLENNVPKGQGDWLAQDVEPGTVFLRILDDVAAMDMRVSMPLTLESLRQAFGNNDVTGDVAQVRTPDGDERTVIALHQKATPDTIITFFEMDGHVAIAMVMVDESERTAYGAEIAMILSSITQENLSSAGTTAAAGDILFHETFDDNRNYWENADMEEAFAGFVDGEFIIDYSFEGVIWTLMPGSWDKYDLAPILSEPYDAEVSFRILESRVANPGVSFGYNIGESYDTSFKFMVYADGAWFLYEGNANNVIATGMSNSNVNLNDGQEHTLGLRVLLDSVTLYLDGNIVATVPNNSIYGTIGLGTRSDVRVAFDDLSIRSLGVMNTSGASSPATTTIREVFVTADQANLRTGPGTDYAIVGSVSNGATMELLSANAAGDWAKVRFEGGEAWIFAELITVQTFSQMVQMIDPADFVNIFYESYIDHMEAKFNGQHFPENWYHTDSSWFTNPFIWELDNYYDRPAQEITGDPFVCGNDLPPVIEAYNISTHGDQTLVNVAWMTEDGEFIGDSYRFTVELLTSGASWKIAGIDCQ